MPSQMRITKDSIEAAILVAALGQLSIFAPAGGAVALLLAKHFIRKWWEEGGPYVPPETVPEQVRESIYKLKRNDYIRWRINRKANKTVIELTKKGQKAFAHASFCNLTIDCKGEWDGYWRFFLFDIPEKRRKVRDILRARVKSLGFFQFQKSVWIFPFECEKELRYICEYLEVTPYTMLFAAKIDNDRVLRRYFLREGILSRRHLNLLDKGLKY